MKEESEKTGLKLNIQKTKIMASGPINSWQTEGEEVEAVTDVIFLGSKITADDDCSYEIKRHLLLWKKSYDKPRQCIKKQKHHFADKDLYRPSYGSSSSDVQMFESWTIKTTECQRNDAFELWYWRRLLRVPWTARSK